MNHPVEKKHPFYIILLLILSGEGIFILPFVLARVFRPTFLAAFELNNTEIGFCFSVYGIVALIAYFFGGRIADAFPPGKLMGIALVATALGGFYMATFPAYGQLIYLYGYWGITTIFLFWAAMIKATRVWGGDSDQIKAFGALEAGRGIVAATVGGLCVALFSIFMVEELEAIPGIRRDALRYVIVSAAIFVFVIGVLVFFFLRTDFTENRPPRERFKSDLFLEAIKIPTVVLLMVIVLCAYVGYKVTDIIPQYANEILGFNEVDSATVGTRLLYLRPIIVLLLILFLRKQRAAPYLIFGFGITLIGAILFASGLLTLNANHLFWFSLIILGIGVYGVRALYFAVMPEGKIPVALTGTAVGLISLIGFTPDIFMGPLIGYFLDGFKGVRGYNLLFTFLIVVSLIGFVTSLIFINVNKKERN